MKSLSLTKPHMIIMMGIPGSGKSFFAQQFGETFHAPVVSYDTTASLVAADDASIIALLHAQIDELVKTRQSIIVDSRAATRTERGELIKRATTAGYEPLYIWVQTDTGTAKLRSTKSKDKTKPALTSDEYDAQLKRFMEPTAAEKAIVISGKHTYATQARVVLKKLSSPRTEAAASEAPQIPPARTETQASSHGNVRNIVIR